MTAASAGDWLRLTNAQQLIWASQQLHPDAPLYNMAFLFEISGEIIPDAFISAFERLIAQCDALRTVVESIDGTPSQRIAEHIEYELPIVDVSTADDPDRAASEWSQTRCETMLAVERQTFDAALLKLGNEKWAWYFNQHHLVTDAWSSALIFERMEELYRGVRREETPGPAMPSFADYLPVEQAEAAGAAEPTTAGTEPAPAVAPYGVRTHTPGTSNVRLTHELTAAQAAALDELATAPGFRALTPDLTRFRILATALFAYLHRVSGQSRLTIGAPAHNRPTAEFRQTAGMFMEVFPLDVELDEGETFASLHEKVTRSADTFIRTARPGGSTAETNRSITTVLNVIRGDFDTFDGAPVHATWLHPGHVDAEHFLRLQVHDFNATGRVTLLFDCNRHVLGDAVLPSVPGHFLRVFEAMLTDPEQPIGAIDVLSSEERAVITAAANPPSAAGDRPASVVSQFEHRVDSDPDALALTDPERRWTYGELGDITARIAAHITPGTVIGVCLGRSAEAVMAMLGVLRAGAAYVPIDPTWPEQRISYVLEDAGCARVISDRELDLPVPAVPLASLTSSEGPAADLPGIRSGDLAYILYTSGSTGRPKGVMIEHGSLAHYLTWASGFYDAGDRISFPLFTPLTFDLTVTSLFVPLVSGGSIIVYPETGGPADTAVQRVFADDAVDIVKLTPSHLALLPDMDLSTSRIRQLILGGEDLTTAVAKRVHDRFGGRVKIHNEYGPTEATVGCIVHTYSPDDDVLPSVPIGRPIPDMRAWVLDDAGQPVPFGVPGELWVAGAGVARGYVGSPALTAERFVANEHLGEPRMYPTGDIARLRPSGTIEYLGRRDDQVKIRGARVELGEVEAALAAHPLVTAAAARVWEREPMAPKEDLIFCTRCGLASDFPDVSFDADRICNHCRSFDTYRDKAEVYFKPMDELQAVFDSGPSPDESDYDCMTLLSGGKDSTYVLCRLVDMGLRVFAFTLDNGYISDEAKANIRRVVDTLGVDHIFATTPAMNEIFVDSLQRHANVCNGCFKTIYTLSLQEARARQIPFIVTGLSRGQFFETRLTEELFTELTVNADEIDANVMETRKAYHQVDDAAHRLLDVSIFEDESIFDEVRYVDFYRYCDVGLDELYAYLDERVPWVRPRDTGRSTNCRINDVGIYFHRRTRGFHNYALPYSWDVRMGHKTRDEALEELDDDIDVAEVEQMLREIGFPEGTADIESGRRLVGYYVAAEEISASDLRAHLAESLPDQMMPALFVRLDAIPLSRNGKTDRTALPRPGTSRPEVDAIYLAPRSEAEVTLAGIWEDVLGIDGIGIKDSFFDLGGDSIMAIQIVARAHRIGVNITLHDLFEALTVERLAFAIAETASQGAERVVGPVGLTPIQHWFFEQYGDEGHFHQIVQLDAPADINVDILSDCLVVLADHHDALRQSFHPHPDGWRSEVSNASVAPTVRVFGTDEAGSAAWLEQPFDLTHAPLLRAGLADQDDGTRRLTLVAHHLIVDAVSWVTIVDDLNHLYQEKLVGTAAQLPPVRTSIRDWVAALTTDASEIESLPWVAQEAPAVGSTTGRTPGPTETAQRSLSASETQALLASVDALPAGMEAVLAGALALTLADWNGSSAQHLFLEGHGRDSADPAYDLTRTVGWFTSLFPVELHLPDTRGPARVAAAAEAQLEPVARDGRNYGVVRYLHPETEVRRRVAMSDGDHVVFNYLGRTGSATAAGAAFRLAGPITLSRAEDLAPSFAAEVSAVINDDHLELTWTSAAMSPGTIEELLNAMAAHVTAIAANIPAESATDTSSEFPLANLDEDGLAKLAAVLEATDRP
ncbi:MAG: amino acid adenylation domain-containing protein [Acidimicrobiia bacterium]|nr:amino acid adenylation domain-containing protein [Acidimicrobiia bacterium]NNF70232.1 amino acid adenylation domain-containing protein [Acidimicrobiia bacterium]